MNLCEVEGCDEMEWLARQLNDAEDEEGAREGKAGYYNYFLLKGQDTFTVRVVCRCGCVVCRCGCVRDTQVREGV